jgi:rRNA maturation endonuclease Nob1
MGVCMAIIEILNFVHPHSIHFVEEVHSRSGIIDFSIQLQNIYIPISINNNLHNKIKNIFSQKKNTHYCQKLFESNQF